MANAKVKSEYQLTLADAGDILADALRLLREAGAQVGARNAPEKDTRPAGIMVYVSGLELSPEGHIVAVEMEPQPAAV